MGHTGPRTHTEPLTTGWQFIASSGLWVYRTHKGTNGGACFHSKTSGLWWATGGVVGIPWKSFDSLHEAQAHALSVKLEAKPVTITKINMKGRTNGYNRHA